jgi:Mg-chelatase subunit ChlD
LTNKSKQEVEKKISAEYAHEAIRTRWRLILGGGEAEGTGQALSGEQAQADAALSALYEYERKRGFSYNPDGKQKGGSEASNPSISRWLGDIRRYFPQSVAQIMQRDALNHPDLKKQFILEPSMLAAATPDVHLVATLLELKQLMPDETRATARIAVQKVVDELLQRLEQRTLNALRGALHRQARKLRPRLNDMDWHTTIRRNLKHYQKDYKTIIPEIPIGFGRRTKQSLKQVILCLDQSGSMGESVVYSGIFGAVLASIPALQTQLIAFDTEIADLTADLSDPVELLFGVQLGGGTDIGRALRYCQTLVQQPEDTILVLISDLYEGTAPDAMYRAAIELHQSGVQIIVLLALDDQGSPVFDRQHASFFASLGAPVFACTPDLFPELMAAAFARRDLQQWAAEHQIVLKQ